jgi:hypothetical protein
MEDGEGNVKITLRWMLERQIVMVRDCGGSCPLTGFCVAHKDSTAAVLGIRVRLSGLTVRAVLS